MRRIRVVGLLFAAVVALGTVAVASASAALPEFQLEAANKFPIEVTSKNATGVKPTLKTTNHTITCETSKDTAEITGAKTVANVRVTYTGCELDKLTKCTTAGKATGEIETQLITGRIDYAVGRTGSEVGLELEPASGTLFAEFKCGLNTTKVEGCTVGEAKPLNEFKTEGTLLWQENAGKQKWTEIVGGKNKPCTLKTGGFFSEAAWLTDEEIEKFFEKGGAIKVKLAA